MRARSVGRSCRLYLGICTPRVLGVGGDVAPTIWHVTYVRIGLWCSGRNIVVSGRIVSAERITLQAVFSLPLKHLPLYRRPLRRPIPHRLSPSPRPSEGRGEALGVSHTSSSPSSSCACSRGGGGGSVVAGSGAVSADSSLTWGGGGSAAIPPSLPSPVLARSPPVPGPSGLLVCDSQSHSRSPGALRRVRTRSRSPRASQSSSGEAHGEQCWDRSRSVGSRVRTRVSRSRFTSYSLSRGRDHSRCSSSCSPSMHSRSRRCRSRSSDRYRYREDRSRSRDDRSRSQRERSRSSCRRQSPHERTRSRRDCDRPRDRLRSLDQSNLSPDRSQSRERYRRRWCMNRWEHERHSSASHVHGHSGSHLSAHAAAPSASKPALRAFANLLVGLTTAVTLAGAYGVTPFWLGLFPVLDLGWGPVFREQCQSPLCLLVRPLRVGFLHYRSVQGRGTFTGIAPLGAVSRAFARSGKVGARRHSPSPTRPSCLVPSLAPASPASLGAGEVRSSPSRGPCSAVGGL